MKQRLSSSTIRSIPTPAFAVLILSALLMAPALASAGTMQVLGSAARTGSFGVEVSIDECTASTNQIVTGSVSNQTITACDTVTASNATVSGTVAFTAGRSISMGDGFRVASGASFSAGIDSALNGEAFLQDNNPTAEATYVARYYVDLSGLTLPDDEPFDQLIAYDGSGAEQFRVAVKRDGFSGENQVFVIARSGAGGVGTDGGQELTLPNGWHAIEVNWTAGSPGSVEICVDADASRTVGACEVLAFDNGTGRVEFVRWGAQHVAPFTAGFFRLDDFDSRRVGNIGL